MKKFINARFIKYTTYAEALIYLTAGPFVVGGSGGGSSWTNIDLSFLFILPLILLVYVAVILGIVKCFVYLGLISRRYLVVPCLVSILVTFFNPIYINSLWTTLYRLVMRESVDDFTHLRTQSIFIFGIAISVCIMIFAILDKKEPQITVERRVKKSIVVLGGIPILIAILVPYFAEIVYINQQKKVNFEEIFEESDYPRPFVNGRYIDIGNFKAAEDLRNNIVSIEAIDDRHTTRFIWSDIPEDIKIGEPILVIHNYNNSIATGSGVYHSSFRNGLGAIVKKEGDQFIGMFDTEAPLHFEKVITHYQEEDLYFSQYVGLTNSPSNREEQRQKDITELSFALNEYNSRRGHYPKMEKIHLTDSTTYPRKVVFPLFAGRTYQDPLHDVGYEYKYSTDHIGSRFIIYYRSETNFTNNIFNYYCLDHRGFSAYVPYEPNDVFDDCNRDLYDR